MPESKYFNKKIDFQRKEINRTFSKLEWDYLPYIDPLFFLDTYFRKEKKELNEKELKIYCLDNLQNIFHHILERFFQSSNKYYHSFIKKEINRYLIFRNVFLKKQYSTDPEMIFELTNQSQLIIDLYQDLRQLKARVANQLNLKEDVLNFEGQFNYQDFKKLGWQYKVIHFLQKEAEQTLEPFIASFFIYGSFATKDFLKNWSDLDTGFILNDNIFANTDYLNRARRQFRRLSLVCAKIDSLFHHRFFFLTQFDLGYYPSYVFPLVLGKYSLLLNGQNELRVNLRSDNYEKIQLMGDFVKYFRDKVLVRKYSQNQIQWKNDLAHLMLWPTLMLQAKGINVYKRDSFDLAKEKFSQIDFSLVDQATKIMKEWSRLNWLKYYPNFLFVIFPFRFNQIIINQHRRYLNRKIKESPREVIRFSRKALSFFEQSINSILREIENEQ